MSEAMDRIEETMDKILRDALVYAKAGDRAHGMLPEEKAEAILGMEPQTKAIMGMLRECLVQARLEGVNSVHRHMHQSSVDSEMLDEAVEYGRQGEPGDG